MLHRYNTSYNLAYLIAAKYYNAAVQRYDIEREIICCHRQQKTTTKKNKKNSNRMKNIAGALRLRVFNTMKYQQTIC